MLRTPNQLLASLLILGSSLFAADRYKDPKSGFEVLEIPATGAAPSNLYYHFSNFTADDANLIYADGAQIWRYEMASGRVAQVSAGEGVAAGSACPHPKQANLLYYMRGPVLEEVDLKTGKVRKVGEIPEPRQGGYQQPTFTHDLKSVTVSKKRDAENWEIGLMDVATGAYRTVTVVGFQIGHIQHHPMKPLIFYVWETGGYAPQRTWLVNDDGTANRPFYYTVDPKKWVTPLKEWITHESWIAGTGEMTLIFDKTGIVITDVKGESRLLGGDYWHVSARPDGRFLVADDSRGNLWLIESATDNRRLLASGLREAHRPNHAHASFDHTGRYVVFNTGQRRPAVAVMDLKAAGLWQ